MNLMKLQDEIANDEGIKYELYRCSEGHLTGGIGHLITEWDEEFYGKPIGTRVPHEQVIIGLKETQVSINDCKEIFNILILSKR